jgi:hypothetical protein
MKQLIGKILIICFLFTPPWLSAEEISKAFMAEHESAGVIYIDKATSSQRSKLSFSIDRILQDNRLIYKYTAHGEGNYDEYKNITFDIEAGMEEKDGLLYPIYSFNLIRNKNLDLIARYEKSFNYTEKKIRYTVSDAKGTIIKNITFPMKGLTVDSATLVYFLKTFAAHHGESSYRTFYLISDKAQLYKINIKDMGIETLEFSNGKINAIKLRLVPDLGLLTGVAKSLIPPTFIWYADQSPYEWLQYEGLETGVGSAHITASKIRIF